jgi:hypothetical protein
MKTFEKIMDEAIPGKFVRFASLVYGAFREDFNKSPSLLSRRDPMPASIPLGAIPGLTEWE